MERTLFLIWNHERHRYWLRSQAGYTDEIAEAGLFNFEQAFTICQNAHYGPWIGPQESLIPVTETIEEITQQEDHANQTQNPTE